MSLLDPLVSVISQCRWEGVILMENGSFSLLHVISLESQDCRRMQLSKASGDIGKQYSFFILAKFDGIFFCPIPNIHVWIIRGWMSFRKWKLNSESQRKSESGRGSSEKENKGKRDKGKRKAKWRKGRKIGENIEGPRRAWARMEMPFCLGFSSWETPEIGESVWEDSLPRSYFMIWNSTEVQYLNEITAHDPLLSHTDQQLDTSTTWKPESILKIGRWWNPNIYCLRVPSSHPDFHNQF